MKLLRISLLLLPLMLVACAESTEPTGSSDTTTIEQAARSQVDRYNVRHDYRRCAWPDCGGEWLSPVDGSRMHCPTGGSALECYVVDLDTSALADPYALDSAASVIVTGSFTTYTVDFRDNTYADLVVERAWTSATDVTASGTYYDVQSTGRVCIQAPCHIYDAKQVGRNRTVAVHSLDLSGAGAKDDVVYEGYAAAETGELLVAGDLRRERINGQWSRTLSATQFFLPVTLGQCLVNADCTQSAYTRPVEDGDDCYCPACPQPMSAAEAEANRLSWEASCSNVRLMCPQYLCVRPPGPLVCADAQCVWQPEELVLQ